jgi:hypothetical protein
VAKIHELIPVESDKVTIANTLIDEAVNTFAKKPDHFIGQTRRVEMYDEARQVENTTDRKELVETVDSKLDHVWGGLREAIDVTMTKENSNTSPEARADVVVNGKPVLKNVPATALLALEKKLSHLKGLYQSIPTLDPSYAWEADDTAALTGTMRTKFPQEGHKTEKVSDVLVLYEATDKHPAQVKEITLDKNVAKVTTDRQSGMISPARKAQLLSRISDLATAVKEARQRANMAEVTPLNVADDIRAFIHG